jgi:hypothetical protein
MRGSRRVNTPDYSFAGTMKALRDTFEANRDKSFEARWELAKSSDAYKGFQIRCSSSAKALATVAIPLLLLGIFASGSALDKDATWPILAAVGLYVVIGVVFSWKLGIRTAKARMTGLRKSDEVPSQHPKRSI